MKTNYLFISMFLLGIVTAFAQGISGHIVSSDDGLSLPGVSVVVEGTDRGTFSDFDGNFTIDANVGDTLLLSSIGFVTQSVVITSDSLEITMQTNTTNLSEVVVVGYGSMKVKDLTSSITTVNSEEIQKTPTSQVMQALQGKVAGLQVVSSGAPGEAPTIRVRGVGSYPSGGNSTPLYVVDGMFFNNIDFLNPSDIASVSVLKDASSAAIYGVRAANGVILIETKSGKANQETQIIYDGYYGTQIAQNVLKMANAEQFTTMVLESGSAPDIEYLMNAMQLFGRSRVNPNIPNVNTNWYKEIMRPAAIQNHSINVSGGSDKATYSLGGNYLAQEGILDMKNEYTKINFRARVDFQANDWLKVGANFITTNTEKFAPEYGAWKSAYIAVPILPIYNEANTEGATPDNFASARTLGYRGGQNPFPALTYSDNRIQGKQTVSNLYAQVELIPNKLDFKTTYYHSYGDSYGRYTRLPYYMSNGFQRVDGSISKNFSTFSNQIIDNILTYTDQKGDHRYTMMVGSAYRNERGQSLGAQGLNFPVDDEKSWYIDQAETVPSESVGDGGYVQYGLSYFTRVQYSFKDKYMFYGTMRADGSSKYQEKWGYFPTLSLGWIVSEEDFFKNKMISYLKLRASWGQLGNDKVSASDGAATTYVVNTAIDDTLTPGTVTSNNFSSLGWEVVEETNIGLTAKLFDNQLSIDADYFIRDTNNAVIPVLLPVVGGSILRNVGSIRNKGFELSSTLSNQVSDRFSYEVSANIGTLNNEVLDLYGQEYLNGGQAEFRQRSIVGEPILAFYGWKRDGVYQTEAEVAADPIAVANNLVPGDLKFVDQNGDGVIDGEDRVVLGSYLPDFTYGGSMNVSYDQLSLSVSWMGQSGNSILNRKRGEYIWTNDTNIDADLAVNRWHGAGTSNTYPSSSGLRRGWNQKMSDFYVEDGSFFRIQNIQLGYTIKPENFPQTRLTLTADRPLTVFSYNGFNPEVASGIDNQTYPIPAVFTLGVNLKF